jgi:hypothetical protein
MIDIISQNIDKTTDRLGKHIDPKIKRMVVALTVYGIKTTASCEGHLNWGYSYPWVDCEPNTKLQSLLDTFSKNHNFWIEERGSAVKIYRLTARPSCTPQGLAQVQKEMNELAEKIIDSWVQLSKIQTVLTERQFLE